MRRDDRYKEYAMHCNCDLGRSVGPVYANHEVPYFYKKVTDDYLTACWYYLATVVL